MSVANLTRYDQYRDCDCGQTCMVGMCEYNDGEYVKFEDAAESYSNSLQLIKAEIAAIAERLQAVNAMRENYHDVAGIVEELRQLSAA